MKNNHRKKLTWREKQKHWLDNKIAQGSLGMIKLLSLATLVMVFLTALFLHTAGVSTERDESFISDLWNTFATIINSWLPYYEDGWVGYRVMMTFAAIFGLLIGSLLIGIISTGIQERIDGLKKGNLEVFEKDHIIVLGFKTGEYSLIQELVNGADKRKCCIVVASENDRMEVEDSIRDNIKCPKNVRILCRTINIFDPSTLEKLSLDTCRAVLISPAENEKIIRTMLAVTRILHDVPNQNIRTIAVLSQNDYRIPKELVEKYGILLLHTEGTIARIIAHSCTQPGLSQTMMELFHFEGSEIHIVDLPGTVGMSFEELLCRVDNAFPIGICKEEKIYLNPPPDMVLGKGDRLLVFCEENDSARLVPARTLPPIESISAYEAEQEEEGCVIIGCNEFLPTILTELPENILSVMLADTKQDMHDEIMEAASNREIPLSVRFYEEDITQLSALEELAQKSKHIVVLSDRALADDESDMRNIFLIMTLRDIRNRLGLNYNITVEMRCENNQNLLIPDPGTEFVVSSNMSSLFLSQLSESPELVEVFDELLTNEGNEVYLKTAEEMDCVGTRTILELRRRLIAQRYVMIGCMDENTFDCSFELTLDDSVTLKPHDKLIVIGEN